jgi:hypothetical protein
LSLGPLGEVLHMELTTDRLPPPAASPENSTPARRRHPATAWWAAATVGGSVLFFVTAASLWLDRPGLYMDESNFVDAALGGHFPHQLYVFQRVGRVPILIIPYIGTLKAFIFAPIFALWGVSVVTIRVPVIIISALTLVVTYFMGREVIGRWSAILVLLMGTCPTFIFMSKVDWGPIALAMFLSASFLLAFLRYVHRGQIGWLIAAFVIVVLGVFDKQNFLWLGIAIGVGAVAVYRRQIWQLVHDRPKATIAAAGAFGFCFLFELALILPNLSSSNGSSSLQDPFSHLAFAWLLYERTVGFSEVIGFFTERVVVQPVWMDFQWVFSLGALAVLALRRHRGPLPGPSAVPAKAAVFFLIVFVVMLVEVAATTQATGPHHVIELLPYPTLVLLCSAVAVARSGPVFRAVGTGIAVAGLTVVLFGQAFATTQYASLMRNPSRFSRLARTDVYRDAAFLNANAGGVDEVVTAGWGPGTPLFSLACSRDRPKYRDDLWGGLAQMTTRNASTEVQKAFGDRRILLVSVHDVEATGLTHNLEANTALLIEAYASLFPGRHPTEVLATNAYDITYFGPGSFQPGHRDC